MKSKIQITCPHCHRPIKFRLGLFKLRSIPPGLTCGRCGGWIGIDNLIRILFDALADIPIDPGCTDGSNPPLPAAGPAGARPKPPESGCDTSQGDLSDRPSPAEKGLSDSKAGPRSDPAIKQQADKGPGTNRPPSKRGVRFHCRGSRLRLHSRTGRWKEFRHIIDKHLKALSTTETPDGCYEIWSHAIDVAPAATVRIFEQSIDICKTGGGPGWKTLLARIARWRQDFDKDLVLERDPETQQDRQIGLGLKTSEEACVHERMMPLAERPGFTAGQWVKDTSWCPDCGVLIIDFYDWHDGKSSVTYLPPSADVLFNAQPDFTAALSYLDSVDAGIYAKSFGFAVKYFGNARYDHTSAWDTLIERLETADPSRTGNYLRMLYGLLGSADRHFDGHVVDIPLLPPELSLEERAEFYRKAFEAIEKHKACFAESPEVAAIDLKNADPVINILSAGPGDNQAPANTQEAYRRMIARKLLTRINAMDNRGLVYMAPLLRNRINMLLEQHGKAVI